jgi:signal transduction histidine kinase
MKIKKSQMEDQKRSKADLIKELQELRLANHQYKTERESHPYKSQPADMMLMEMITHSPVSIQILDKEGFSVVINDAHTKCFGVRPPPGYNMFRDTLLLEQELADSFHKLQQGEAVFFPDTWYNARLIDPCFPDKMVWIKTLGFPLLKEKGEPKGYVVMHEDITENRMLEEKLQKSNLELQILNLQIENHRKYIQDAVDQEKTDVSKFLHDELGQILTGITLKIFKLQKKITDPALNSELVTILTLISESINIVQNTAYKLQSPIVRDLGIALAIESLTDEFAENTEIEMIPEIDLTIEMELSASENIYRIVRESFTNIIRHANASRVNLTFSKTATSVVLTISDNGQGITDEAIASAASFGIKTMRERAESAGGVIAISGEKGKGTKIKIEFPVQKNMKL